MSVIVKGMKMPTGCGSCDFAGFLPDEDPYCRRLMRTIRVTSKRLDDCPLGTVQPHGRLIDADALIKNHFSDEHRIAMSYADKCWMRRIINEEPTILPAEGEQT